MAGKVHGSAVTLKLATVEKGIYDSEIDEKSDDIDVTDTMSPGGQKEYVAGLISRSLSFSAWFRDDETQPEVGSTSAFTMDYGAKRFSGTLVFTNRRHGHKIEDAVKVLFEARISGAMVIGAAS